MLKTFEQFIFEKSNEDYLKKVNFILAGEDIISLTGDNNIKLYGDINVNCFEKLFNTYYGKVDI